MIEIALAAGAAAVLMLIVLYVSSRSRAKQMSKETYRKELDEEVEKYIPKKASVKVYSGVVELVKESPELGKIPMIDIVKGFEREGHKSLKEAYSMLISEGVKPERVERLVVNIGKVLGEEIGMVGDKYAPIGLHQKGKRQIDITSKEDPQEWRYIIAHELTHRIMADSPFGEYEKDLARQAHSVNSKVDPLVKIYEERSSKAEKIYQRMEKSKDPAKRRKLESEYNKIEKKIDNIMDRLRKIRENSRKISKEMVNNTAIGEAVSYAVEDALRGKGVMNIREMDEYYGAPVSVYYNKVKKFVEKKGVKAAIEAVRMINPEKAKRSRKHFKSFEDMYKRTMGKSS